MSQNSIFLYFYLGFGVAAIAVIIVLAIRGDRRRTREMAEAALQLGFRFLGSNWSGPVLPPHLKTSLLKRSHGRYNNVMTGWAGDLEVSIFDYTYGEGKSAVTQTLACFSQDLELPPFELRPEGVFDKIGEAFVHNDIDFDSYPDFSRRYLLRSPDEANTRKLFTPSLLTYVEQIPPDKKWHIEGTARTLIVYRGGLVVKPAALPAFLNESSAIARVIFSSNGLKKPVT